MKFRKKPVVIEAVLFNGRNTADIHEFCGDKTREPVGENHMEIVTLEGVMKVSAGDYVIKGVNGEFYPCKPDIFAKTYDPAEPVNEAKGYTPMDQLSFGTALLVMKSGRKVARKGWNGKGMWIVLMPRLQLPPHSRQEPGAKVNDRTAKHIGVDTPLDSQPYIAMWTAPQQWQPGWLASQADMLADDWMVVE